NKASATATINSPIAINGNLTLSTGGQLDLISNITVGGNVLVNSSTILNAETSTIGVGGNWTQSGTFFQGSGTVNFNGSIDQNIGASTFANLTFNKPSGIAYATGDLNLNGNATLNSGTLNLGIFNLNRTALGGTLTLASGSTLYIGGSNNTPSNFDLESIAASSNVIYNGNAAQNVVKLGYGNLIFSNGNSLAKTISQPISVSGDFTINSGATVAGSSNTITLMGNWVSTGTFIPGTGTVIMSGVNKFISSNKSSFNNLTLIVGSIISSTAPSITSVNGNFTNKGFFTQASDSIYLYGDFLNTGTVNLNGVTNIMGIAVQNFQNDGTLSSGLSGVVNLNGTVSPNTFSSTNASFSTLNINNTGVVAPIVTWSVGVAMNIGPGATFNGNGLTHNIAGSFSNSGTVLNDGGTFNFVPNASRSINLGANFSCTGIVNFAGSNALTLSGTGNYTFGSVNVTNSNSAGIMATSDWNIAGTFFIKPGSIFHAGTARTINLQSNINVSGIFDGGSSTVVMQDTAAINGIGDINFNNLNIASKDSLLTDIKISGNFINNGDFYHNGYKVTFNGSGPSLISGTTTPIGFEDLAISKTADTTSLGCDITIGDTLIISSGSVLKGSTRTITISGNWIQDGTYTYNTSTTLFQGTVNQKITGLTGGSFYNLTIDNAGVEVSLGSNAKVQNLMTLTALSKFNSTGFEQIFVSNAKGTASLAALPAGAVFTGNIRMQRYLPPVSGRYWYQAASPVNNATVAMWQNGAPTNGFYVTGPFTGASAPVGVGVNSAGTSAFTWNSATALWSRFPVNSNTENIISKKGYRVLVRDGNPTYNSGNTAAKTFSVLGTPNTGNQTIALLYNATGGSPAGGWNFIGNPYPSNIDGDLSNSGWQTASANLASNATYTYNTSSGTYIVCNGGVGMCPIASSQGFWVKVNTGGGTLTATETVKTSTIQALRRVVPPTYTPIVLTSTQNLLSDITYLRFEDDATMGFDKQYDAYKLTMATPTAEAVPVLLSSFTNGIELSINARPVPTASDTIPLTVAVSDGNYQLDFSQKENLYGQYQMYLLDKFSKQTIDLKITPLYNFQVSKQDTSTTNKRFSVIFKNSNVITAVETDKNAFSSYLVFPNPVKDKIVKLRTPSNEKKVNIIITDLLGKEIYTGNEENNLNEVILKLNSYNITPGSYIITVKGQFSNFVQKLLFE
ncbi:MAG: T9SS type A sorting domain-containing protein, partial [Bacteroidia bacterium]|nr:T9SS type A sorting domain-containing protein [Bacteroidia bacterium]